MSIPTYIYKIVPSDLIVLPLPERLPVSSFDAKDGFIHLSTAKQLPRTLGRFFSSETKIYILRIEYKSIEGDIRWEITSKGNEPGDIGCDGVYPHLYNGGHLGSEEVENVVTLEREGENWNVEKIKESDWLIY